jgi:peptidyl-prolyl cis-trans isomerase SurA
MSFTDRARAAIAAAVLAAAWGAPAFGQEAPTAQLVEEVVARVNADVITRSQYMQALSDTENDFKTNLPAEEAKTKLAELRPKLLDLMIDNMLLVQKAQDMGIDVEAQINKQFLEMAKQQNMSITEFEEAMRKGGIEPNEARARLRERMLREAVINQEVYGTIWRGLTEREKREFYDKNKEKFMQAGELKLSEIFLPVEGRSFGEIEAKAGEIAASARNGAAFSDLVKKHGDPTRASYAGAGALGSFKSVDDLSGPIAKAIGPLKAGQVADPIRMADGVIILRVDERREAAPRPFEEVDREVSMSLVYERSRDAETRYIEKLRREAYIKVTSGYETTAYKDYVAKS